MIELGRIGFQEMRKSLKLEEWTEDLWRKGHLIRALKDVEIRYVEKGGMRRKQAKVQGNVAFSEQTGFWTRWEGMQRTRGGIVQDVKQH